MDVRPSPESPPPELVATPERGPAVKIPAPPPLPPPPLKLPDKLSDKFQDARPGRRPEITIDVIHSRGRWRAFGVCMGLLVMGLVALLAAWRLVPDRLPAEGTGRSKRSAEQAAASAMLIREGVSTERLDG